MSAAKSEYTAAVVVIGNEILSGRTQDANLQYLAKKLNDWGVRLREARVIPDIEEVIIRTINEVRATFDYVFTTGGIGPTHDDITADAVAKAFGVPIVEDPRAIALLLERIKPEDLNAARRRMARIPQGGELVENKISKAPGFMIGNVVVMAGVPSIMQAMLDGVAPRLKTGAKMLVESVEAGNLPEGLYAADLADIAERHAGVSIGSYPAFVDGRFRNQIVLRSKDEAALAAAIAETRALVDRLSRERRSA